MNVREAETLIYAAAKNMNADVYSPEAWGDQNSDAYAIVPSTGNVLVMVRTDDVMDAWEMIAYAYRTDGRVTRAHEVMPALMEEDGTSIDPVTEGLAPGGPSENTADDIETAIVDALGKADEEEEREDVVREVAALLPSDLHASRIPTPGEPFTAVLVADTSDVATIIRYDGFDRAVEVEGGGASDSEYPTRHPSIAHAVAAIIAHRDAR